VHALFGEVVWLYVDVEPAKSGPYAMITERGVCRIERWDDSKHAGQQRYRSHSCFEHALLGRLDGARRAQRARDSQLRHPGFGSVRGPWSTR